MSWAAVTPTNFNWTVNPDGIHTDSKGHGRVFKCVSWLAYRSTDYLIGNYSNWRQARKAVEEDYFNHNRNPPDPANTTK